MYINNTSVAQHINNANKNRQNKKPSGGRPGTAVSDPTQAVHGAEQKDGHGMRNPTVHHHYTGPSSSRHWAIITTLGHHHHGTGLSSRHWAIIITALGHHHHGTGLSSRHWASSIHHDARPKTERKWDTPSVITLLHQAPPLPLPLAPFSAILLIDPPPPPPPPHPISAMHRLLLHNVQTARSFQYISRSA